MPSQVSRERRRYDRYPVRSDVFLAVRPEFARIGKILDISLGGASFEYASEHNTGLLNEIEVDIFTHPREFHLPRIRCSVIYDRIAQESPSLLGFRSHRCGLVFQFADSGQERSLRQFVIRHKTEAVLGQRA